jgi:hypothetical protein
MFKGELIYLKADIISPFRSFLLDIENIHIIPLWRARQNLYVYISTSLFIHTSTAQHSYDCSSFFVYDSL